MKIYFSIVCICIWVLVSGMILPPNEDTEAELAKEVFELVNSYRSYKGLRKLRPQKALHAIAAEHSKAMALGKREFSHDGFQDRIVAVRQYANIPYRVAENLYANYGRSTFAQNAMRGWLNSPGHKKNLDGDFLYTGIAVAKSPSGEYFITQLFVGKKP